MTVSPKTKLPKDLTDRITYGAIWMHEKAMGWKGWFGHKAGPDA